MSQKRNHICTAHTAFTLGACQCGGRRARARPLTSSRAAARFPVDSCAGLGASQWFVGGAQCRPSGKRPWIWVFQWVGRRFRRVGGRLGRLDVEGGSARNQPRWAGRIRGSVAEIGEIRTEIRPKSGVRPRARSVDSADYRRRLDRADDWPGPGWRWRRTGVRLTFESGAEYEC